MRKYKFKQVKNYITLFRKLVEGVCVELRDKSGNLAKASEYLQTFQQKAIELGEYIESEEGLGHATVSTLEELCEVLYQVNEDILSERGLSAESAKNRLDSCINKVEKSANEDIKIQRLVVFLPYKASMWDSLESVWMAAEEDPDCTAYVIPIPYYDINPDRTVKSENWEGDLFPDYVPITPYQDFDFGAEHPDMIFIHNPYDDCNLVTSVHPFFYSDKLKKYTDCLVYIPYFATSGAMSEAQSLLPAYFNADYIVIQSEKFKGFYDERVPREKLLPFGSPKFDSVIRKCKNPPEPPEEWKEKMAGKKVYFYNTSLNGMLADTEAFMKKMVYVFDTFRGRDDACLLWRPHPLFEKTLGNMRPEFLPVYQDIRDKYIKEDWGIYDTTPSIESTIALCDVYIGDSATSVTSLFGVVGKPLFILNNKLHSLPPDDLWEYAGGPPAIQLIDGTWHKDVGLLGNKLYRRDGDKESFVYDRTLDFPASGGYYTFPYEYKKNKLYVFPSNAQDIYVVEGPKERKISLPRKTDRAGAFSGVSFYKNLAIIWAIRYPDIVVFNMETEQVFNIGDIGTFNVAVMPDLERLQAVRIYYKDKMYIFSNDGTKVCVLDLKNVTAEIRDTGITGLYFAAGARRIDDRTMWLIPYEGTKVVRFDMETFKSKEYDLYLEGMDGWDRRNKTHNFIKFFSSAAVLDDRVIFSPMWGNMFVELNPETGEVKEWESPFEITFEDINDYMPNGGIGVFGKDVLKDEYRYYYYPKNQIFKIDLDTKEIEQIKHGSYSKEDIYSLEEGYHPISEWMKYCCCEGQYNTLKDLLDDNITGNKHKKLKQLEDYADINSSIEGDCGEKVYWYLK